MLSTLITIDAIANIPNENVDDGIFIIIVPYDKSNRDENCIYGTDLILITIDAINNNILIIVLGIIPGYDLIDNIININRYDASQNIIVQSSFRIIRDDDK